MNKKDAERITTQYLKPIFGFALKRCKSLQDAEDLAQEIVLKAFHTLITRNDLEDYDKFIWTIAHNALSNYYRDNASNFIGVPIEEIADVLSDNNTDISYNLVMQETIERLQSEIAYLTKLQRRIIILYYYESKKQSEIAKELSIPIGTVKWHLFKAKEELKRGMDTVRTSGELKFNPIRFAICGTSGSVGSKGGNGNFFRSALSQNIEYVVLREAKTVGEIADALGVSPVYVESEAEYLEEYGFLTKRGDKYLCNILLDEPSSELNELHDEMYEKAARIFANELYDELLNSRILENEKILGGYNNEITLTHDNQRDTNFMLWALIPYIAAVSGKSTMNTEVSFEKAATIRPDGGHNICYASVLATKVKPPKYFDSILKFCGPCWNSYKGLTLWQVDSEWSNRRVGDTYRLDARRDLTLLSHWADGTELSEEEYAYLIERGYLKVVGNTNGIFKAGCECVWIEGDETVKALVAIGDKIKERHSAEFNKIKRPYIKAVLDSTPKQLRAMQKYSMQFIFFSDGWFMLYCLKELVNSGKLKLPTEKQKQSLSTVIIHSKYDSK